MCKSATLFTTFAAAPQTSEVCHWLQWIQKQNKNKSNLNVLRLTWLTSHSWPSPHSFNPSSLQNQNIPTAYFALKKRGIMGKGQSEEWDEKHSETRQTQPQRYRETESRNSGSSCPKCCLQTRDCLMSPECGRALQISSVVAFCGSCIRMWMCKKIISCLDDSLQYITFKKGLKCFRFVPYNIAKPYLSTARSF